MGWGIGAVTVFQVGLFRVGRIMGKGSWVISGGVCLLWEQDDDKVGRDMY